MQPYFQYILFNIYIMINTYTKMYENEIRF